MARFNYKMQNILDIKYKLETQAKTSYSLAASLLAREEGSLAVLRDRKAGYEDMARKSVSSRLDLREIKSCSNAVESMKEAIKNQAVLVHVAQKNLEAARSRLNEVMVERKTHEILRDKAFEQFKRELEMEESKAIDELVSYSYQSKN